MASPSAVVDVEILEELGKFCDRTTISHLIDTFLRLTPEQLEAAQEALSRGDLYAVQCSIHSMRSGIGSLGALRMAPIAEAIELQAQQHKADGLATDLERLTAEFAAFRDALNAWRAQLNPSSGNARPRQE